MYTATNQHKTDGAAVMFYPGFMDHVAKELGGDIFILPSSVHEVMIVLDDGNLDAQELKEMAVSINTSEVAPDNQFTNNVYHYDAQKKIFETVEKFEARNIKQN